MFKRVIVLFSLQTCRSGAACWHTNPRCTCCARTWLQTWN